MPCHVSHHVVQLVNSLEHDRCAQAKILHIAVDTQSEVRKLHFALQYIVIGERSFYYFLQEGTVYIKTLSTEEAGKVFG